MNALYKKQETKKAKESGISRRKGDQRASDRPLWPQLTTNEHRFDKKKRMALHADNAEHVTGRLKSNATDQDADDVES